MKENSRAVKFTFSITLFLFANLLTGINNAHAITPVLSTTSNISNGALDPSILVAGTNLSTDLNKFGFTVDFGTTGLTFDSASYISPTKVRLNLRGVALAGSISIQAQILVFQPVADSPSNTLIINVPDPLIAQTITFDALTPMLVNESNQILSANSTSGLEVTFSSKTPTTCKIISLKIHAVAAGNCSIKASQSGNSTYQAAPDIIKSATISPVLSAVVESTVAATSSLTTFATVQYSPTASSSTYKDLVLSSSGNSQLGSVKLRLSIPSGATKGQAAFLVSSYSSDSENEQGFFVAKIGLVDQSGAVLSRVEKAFEISMPKGYFYNEQYWSSDGISWQKILETRKKTLTNDSNAVFFREIDGSVSILTDQLGLFGYRFPQAELEVISPALKMPLASQIQLRTEGGSGVGDVSFGTSTAQVCTVTPSGVLTGKQAGDCFVFARKNASEMYIDSLSNKIVVAVQSSTVVTPSKPSATPSTPSKQSATPSTPSKGTSTAGNSTCTFLSYSLTTLVGEVQATFCPSDAGKVAILYVRTALSTNKWVNKKVKSAVIDSNGTATFLVDQDVSSSNNLQVFVDGEHRI